MVADMEKGIICKSISSAPILVMAVSLIIAANSFAQETRPVFSMPDTLRLELVISAVLQNNDRAAAARLMEKAVYDEIGPAAAWDDPMLMLGVQNLPTSFDFAEDAMTMKMIGLSQKIHYAGEKGLQKKAAISNANAVREQTKNALLELITNAKLAYFNLYYQQQALTFVTAQRDIQQDVLSSVTARLRSDQANQSDIAAAQADLWRLQADILASEQDVEAAQNELLPLMGLEPNLRLPPLAEPDFNALGETSELWLARADNYPPLQKLKFQSENYRCSASAARRMRWPMLELEGSYGFREDIPPDPESMAPPMKADNVISFQINLSLPVFSGRQQENRARAMDAMRRSNDAEYSQMRREIEANLKTLHARAQRLSQSLVLYRDRIIPADQDAYQSARVSFTANRLPFVSLQTYALNIYRDRLMVNQIAYELARTLAEAEKYFSDSDNFNSQ
jgi:outer membrane protein TolC